MPASSASSKLARLVREAAGCTRCPLYRNATQTVFGEGPANARLMMVGEQPGDQEDIAGRPFVGLRPASCSIVRWKRQVSTARRSISPTR
jgi:DNA polymerase